MSESVSEWQGHLLSCAGQLKHFIICIICLLMRALPINLNILFEHTWTMFIEHILATCCYNISSTIALLFVWNLPFCLSILCKLICNVCCNIGWVLVWYWIMPELFCNQIFDDTFSQVLLVSAGFLQIKYWYMIHADFVS